MSAKPEILRLISNLKLGEMFTTRHCLSFGSRGTIDNALHFLVKNKIIIRVARGVFMRPGSPIPTPFQVAKVKAEAFGKTIFEHGADSAHALGFQDAPNNGFIFATSGRSSTFRFGEIIIRFIGTCPRKILHKIDETAGKAISAMWHLGKEQCTEELVEQTYSKWGFAVNKIKQSASLLPEWMNSLFYWARTSKHEKNKTKHLGFVDLCQVFPENPQFFSPH